jgi:hypothetical protein
MLRKRYNLTGDIYFFLRPSRNSLVRKPGLKRKGLSVRKKLVSKLIIPAASRNISFKGLLKSPKC